MIGITVLLASTCTRISTTHSCKQTVTCTCNYYCACHPVQAEHDVIDNRYCYIVQGHELIACTNKQIVVEAMDSIQFPYYASR